MIIIDAERKYGPLAKALSGEIIEIPPHSQHHLSPLDLGSDYTDDENPVAMKSEIITSILEQQMGAGRMSASHKSIIDRCTTNIYQNYFQGKGKVRMPLLTDWREEVLKQADPGHGLLRFSGALVPFANTIPRDSGLYRLMSTTPGES